MGDTLAHLPTVQSVADLLNDVAAAVGKGGLFVARFRDYADSELRGDACFIPVRSDPERILTCFPRICASQCNRARLTAAARRRFVAAARQ
jgi:hypothetical protein